VPGKKSRLAAKVATAVVGAAGACVLLAACSTIKMGSAALVGDQRITTATLDAQVSSLQATAAKYPSQVQLPPAEMPRAALTWLIRFQIRDRMAQDAGVSVTEGQINAELSALDKSQRQQAASSGMPYAGLDPVLANNGIAPSMAHDLGKYEAQLVAFAEKTNGGQLPTSQADVTKALAAAGKADCQAQKALAVQVNPQFGQLSWDTQNSDFTVLASADTLSRPGGKTAPTATASPSLPAC
jgi:peptidyl-prolyl cis-trans isomerase SurA